MSSSNSRGGAQLARSRMTLLSEAAAVVGIRLLNEADVPSRLLKGLAAGHVDALRVLAESELVRALIVEPRSTDQLQ